MNNTLESADKLKNILSPLCTTDEDRKILEALCEALESIEELEDGSYLITFEDRELECAPAKEVKYIESVPRSFSEIAGVVSSIAWDGGGPYVGFEIDDDGLPCADDSGLDYLDGEYPEGARGAFMCGQNWLLFDPSRQLSNGEEALAFVSHEGGGFEPVKSADKLDYKGILLRLISDQMIETNYLPEIYC